MTYTGPVVRGGHPIPVAITQLLRAIDNTADEGLVIPYMKATENSVASGFVLHGSQPSGWFTPGVKYWVIEKKEEDDG